jgi:uncharacterized protein (TIGR02391 family)
VSASANYRLIAIQVGDALKYQTSVNEISRIGGAVFGFKNESFPNESITSVRAQNIHNWILSLARQDMNPQERNEKLWLFCSELCSNNENLLEIVRNILVKAGVPPIQDSILIEFNSRCFHPHVIEHCRKLFRQRNYFHAVFEACKVYNKLVREKSQSSKDGEALMMDVWGWQNGVLKATPCQSETDQNVQDGIKFLSSGLMRAMRNPTAHEPALHWPITKEDCLDMLSFVSFLFRQLDKSIYYKT